MRFLLRGAVVSVPVFYFFFSIFSRKKYCLRSWVQNFFLLGGGGRSKVRGGFFCVGRSFFSAVFTFPAVFFFVKNRGACRFFVFFFAVRFNGFCVKKCFSRVYFYVYFLFPKRTQTLVMLAHRIKSIGPCITKKESWGMANNVRGPLLQIICSIFFGSKWQRKRTSVVNHSFSFNQRRRYAVITVKNHRLI